MISKTFFAEIGKMKIRRRLFAAYKRSDGVNDKCVLKKLKKDERNEKGEFVYRKQNIFKQENFDNTLDYDDIEAGMEIEVIFQLLQFLIKIK